jgi:hypothetical protein
MPLAGPYTRIHIISPSHVLKGTTSNIFLYCANQGLNPSLVTCASCQKGVYVARKKNRRYAQFVKFGHPSLATKKFFELNINNI